MSARERSVAGSKKTKITKTKAGIVKKAPQRTSSIKSNGKSNSSCKQESNLRTKHPLVKHKSKVEPLGNHENSARSQRSGRRSGSIHRSNFKAEDRDSTNRKSREESRDRSKSIKRKSNMRPASNKDIECSDSDYVNEDRSPNNQDEANSKSFLENDQKMESSESHISSRSHSRPKSRTLSRHAKSKKSNKNTARTFSKTARPKPGQRTSGNQMDIEENGQAVNTKKDRVIIAKPTGKSKKKKNSTTGMYTKARGSHVPLDALAAREQLIKDLKSDNSKDKFEVALKSLQENYTPDSLQCRDKEKLIIKQFIESGLDNKGNSQTLCKNI